MRTVEPASIETSHRVSTTGKIPLPSSCRGLLFHFPLLPTLTPNPLPPPPDGILPEVVVATLRSAGPPPPPTAPQVLHRQEAAAALPVQDIIAAAAPGITEQLDVVDWV